MNDIRKDLENSKGDYAYSGAKALVGSIPGIGGIASEAMSLIISEPVSKRRDEWIIRIYEELMNLKDKVNEFSIESLSNNDQFVTVLLNATQIALRNHDEEKLLALKNACVNTADNISIDDEKQLVFLQYVNELTSLDIKLLIFFNNPMKVCEEKGINTSRYYSASPLSVFHDCYKDLDKTFVEMRLEDLIAKGLLSKGSYSAGCTLQGMLASRTTEVGKEFIRYITR